MMDEQRIAGIRAAAQQWADNYALLTGKQVIALLDALSARDAEVARLRGAVFSVEWMENELCTSDSMRYYCPFCIRYSASDAHDPAKHEPDCVISLASPPPVDGADDGIDWNASYREAHAEANAWKELLDERAVEVTRLRQELERLYRIASNECADEPENERMLVAMQEIARAALAAVSVPPSTPKTKNLPTG
jgi:hypothetical protein